MTRSVRASSTNVACGRRRAWSAINFVIEGETPGIHPEYESRLGAAPVRRLRTDDGQQHPSPDGFEQRRTGCRARPCIVDHPAVRLARSTERQLGDDPMAP